MGFKLKDIAHLIPGLRQKLPSGRKPKRAKREKPPALPSSPNVSIVEMVIPIRTVNALNSRQEWWAVSKRGVTEKLVAMSVLARHVPLPALPVIVEMTRLGKGNRAMDVDGCWASLKHVKDSVADAYGIDDADPRIEFAKPGQKIKQPEYGVEVVIRAVRPGI